MGAGVAVAAVSFLTKLEEDDKDATVDQDWEVGTPFHDEWANDFAQSYLQKYIGLILLL